MGYVTTVVAQLLGRFGLMGANLGSLALIARLLPQDQFGIYVLATGLVLLLAQIADFGTGAIFGQYAGAIGGDEAAPLLPGAVWGSFLLVRAGLAFVATALGVAGSLVFSPGASWPFIMASCACGFAAARFLDPLYQATGRPWRSAATQSAGAAAILGAAALAALLHPTLAGFVAGFAVAQIVFVLVSWRAGRDLIAWPARIDMAISRRMLALAAPIGLAGVMTAINGRGNLLFLAHYSGPDALALYGAANRVLDLAVNLTVVALWPLIPIFSRTARQGMDELAVEVRKATGTMLHLVLPVLVVAPALSPIVIRVLYGVRYAAATPVLAMLALVAAGVVFSLLASYALLAVQVTRYAIPITGLGAAFSLACNAALVPRFGAMGAAVSAVGTEAVLLSLACQALLRHVPGAIAWRSVLPMLAAAAAASLALRLLMPFTGPAICVLVLLPAALQLYRVRHARTMAVPDAAPEALLLADDVGTGV